MLWVNRYYSYTQIREFFKVAVGPVGKSTNVWAQALVGLNPGLLFLGPESLYQEGLVR